MRRAKTFVPEDAGGVAPAGREADEEVLGGDAGGLQAAADGIPNVIREESGQRSGPGRMSGAVAA